MFLHFVFLTKGSQRKTGELKESQLILTISWKLNSNQYYMAKTNCNVSRGPIIIIIIIISVITVFAGVLFVHQPGANHAPRALVTQFNHSVHTLRTFLRIRADPSMQIF